MNYYLCPRCQFRVAANAHICKICGYVAPAVSTSRDGKDANASFKETSKARSWTRFLGLDSANAQPKETGKEKPALS